VQAPTTQIDVRAATKPAIPPLRLGVVRYLNTRPLLAGLESLQDLRLRPEVPADLVGALERGEVDAALCSSIDYQRSSRDLVLLPVGLLGCDGPTLTVQVFSRRPLDRIETLHADLDSHTSRALVQVVLAERFGIRPVMLDATLPAGDLSVEAILQIGDKVVLDAPSLADYPHRLDLGEAWKEATGLPFTFACWMAPRPQDDHARSRLATLAAVLDHQRRRNAARLAWLARSEAGPRGWPADEAERYLCRLLRFEWNAAQRAGLELFWQKAAAMGLIGSVRPIEIVEPACHLAPACG
jgi:chorismate dehydratase